FLVVAIVATTATVLLWQYTRGVQNPSPAQVASAPPAPPPETNLTTESLLIKSGDTLSDLLLRAGIDQASTAEMISAVKKAFDVRKFRAGSQLMLTRSEPGTFKSLEYVIDPDHKLELSNSGGVLAAAVVDVPGITRVVPVRSKLEGSLFESIERSGEQGELAFRMAEIFAWDLDFYTDPRAGDEFCVLVEKKEYMNGQPPSYGRILAARYNNAGTIYDAFLFPDKDGKPRFYSYEGRSLQSAFLRSPMKFEARVSSRFSRRRLHPVLKRYRAHLGTDYAAPTGTPVQAVAAGRVVFSGRSGGSGNLIRIKHSGGYETYYLHLSRRYVRRGQHVQQGQRIGSVGSTGLATGPHLDFRIRKNGSFVDFERLKLPRSSKLSAAQADAFAAARDRFIQAMDAGTGSRVAAVATGTLPGMPTP
ncbi:MAG: peptidoglycan DD-metalloendopeptidase family protein, partial [Bryobacteraceae bacterium]